MSDDAHDFERPFFVRAEAGFLSCLAVASKAASFALLMRIFLVALGSASEIWIPMLGAVALLTMTLGNIAALSQNNMKRLLA